MSHQPIPKFSSEDEEATWWDAHPEVLAERFQTAKQQGQVRRLSQTNLPGASESVTEEKQFARGFRGSSHV